MLSDFELSWIMKTKKQLIEEIEKYEKYCDESDTWYRSDLVEHALSLFDDIKKYLNGNQ